MGSICLHIIFVRHVDITVKAVMLIAPVLAVIQGIMSASNNNVCHYVLHHVLVVHQITLNHVQAAWLDIASLELITLVYRLLIARMESVILALLAIASIILFACNVLDSTVHDAFQPPLIYALPV